MVNKKVISFSNSDLQLTRQRLSELYLWSNKVRFMISYKEADCVPRGILGHVNKKVLLVFF